MGRSLIDYPDFIIYMFYIKESGSRKAGQWCRKDYEDGKWSHAALWYLSIGVREQRSNGDSKN